MAQFYQEAATRYVSRQLEHSQSILEQHFELYRSAWFAVYTKTRSYIIGYVIEIDNQRCSKPGNIHEQGRGNDRLIMGDAYLRCKDRRSQLLKVVSLQLSNTLVLFLLSLSNLLSVPLLQKLTSPSQLN